MRLLSLPRPVIVLLLTLGFNSLALGEAPARETLNFNAGWLLKVGDVGDAQAPDCKDADWVPVTLPRAWNEDEAFKKDIKDLSTGIAWYRKHFILPAASAGKKVFLEFEGVRQTGEFWLNGKRLGRHENGITAFGFDITDYVKPAPEQNILAVRTDNDWDARESLSGSRFQWSDKNFNANYGGIPKNVRLHITDRVYQTLPLYSHLGSTGVYLYATDFDIPGRSATIHAESEIRNEDKTPRTFTYQVSIADKDGHPVASFTGETYTLAPRESITARASARVENLNFWSWGYGYLYSVTTKLESEGKAFDTVTTRTGFRKTEFAHGMVKLNDRVIQLKGYAQRTSNEWPAIGLSVPPWLSDFSNGLMVESGANLVRWMHITPWRQDVESCDRVGLMQMMPAGDSEKDAQGRSWVLRTEVMRDAIIYFRNNPSILVYECGNNGISEAHMAEMKALRNRFDPQGGRAIGSRDMLGSKEAEYGGEMLYVNKSARQPFWQTEYSRDEALRKYWDELSPPYHKEGDGPLYNKAPAREYNRNQDSHAIENVMRWYDFWRERPGTGTRVNSGGVNIVFSDTNTHHRGAENYRCSGEVDAMRIPKDGFYAHQVMWDGWVDVERPRAHIIGHWNYAPGVEKDIQVVSSAESVELFLNGQFLGRAEQSHRFLHTLRGVKWQPGQLHAVGYDARGLNICEAWLTTAGEPSALKLTVQTAPDGFSADGADLALVQVEVVDALGQRCPTALNLVNFELTGPAIWRGGIAQGPDNYILARSLPVECGVNRVLVRSTTTPGHIKLTASSPGLVPAVLEFSARPLEEPSRTAQPMPGDHLAGRLDRGPTPLTPSFHVTRQSIAVDRVLAGSNASQAAQSCDDDETTAWTSGNEAGEAWIEYHFARQAKVNQVNLKLSGFRERSYPVRLIVDGKQVWEGLTDRSLGYVNIPFDPTLGQSVRVELTGTSKAGDAFNIKELADQANAGSGTARVRTRSLSIIEAEFYEPVTP